MPPFKNYNKMIKQRKTRKQKILKNDNNMYVSKRNNKNQVNVIYILM